MRTGTLMALAACFGWSLNVVFSRMLAGVVPPFTLIFLRCAVAFIVFAPFAGKTLLREWPIVRARLGFYIFLSLAGLGLFNAMVYLAGQSIGVINMALLNAFTPVFAMLLARFFLGDSLTPRRILGIVAAVLGVALLTTKGDVALLKNMHFQIGDAYMLGAAFLFAAYTVGMRFKSPELSNNALILTTFIVSFVFLMPISAWEIVSGKPLAITPQSVTGVLYLGIVASVLCYIGWTGAIHRIGSGNAALIYYTLPLFSAIEGVLLMQETFHWYHYTSGALIITGVVLATKR